MNSRQPLKIDSKLKVATLIAAAVLALGYSTFLRVRGLGEQSLWIDEGYTVNAAQSVLEKGVPVLDSGKLYSNGMLSTYAAAASMKAFSFDPYDPWPARLPFALAGAAIAPVLYLVARRLFSSGLIAAIASGTVAFSYWEIAWSRQARGYAFLSMALLIAFAYSSRAHVRPLWRAIAASLAAFGAAYASHGLALAFLPAFGFLWASRLFLERSGAYARKAVAAAASLAALGLFLLASWAALPVDTSTSREVYLASVPFGASILFAISLVALAMSLFDRARFPVIFPALAFGPAAAASIILFSPYSHARYLLPVLPFLALALGYASVRTAELLEARASGIRPLVACAVALVLALPGLAFAPSSRYALESGSPQPDFRSAFEAIQRMRKEGDVVVSPYAQLHRVYLGEPGMWLAMSLTGKQGELERRIVDGRDYYANAPVIRGAEALKDVLSQRHGFVLVDSLAKGRLLEEMRVLAGHEGVETVFSSGSSADMTRLELYRF